MVDRLFEQLNIPRNECQLYLSLADLGKATAALLAKNLQQPRSTVYSLLNSLIAKGLVAQEKSHDTTYFVPSPPEALRSMLESERRESSRRFEEKEKAVNELIPSLQAVFKSKNFSIPKLLFVEGAKAVESFLHQHCREWQRSISMGDFTWWGYQDHQFVEGYRDWLDFYWNSMEPQEKILLLSNRSPTERKLKDKVARRIVKVVPERYHFSSTIWILGDYVVTIMTRDKPHYAVQLHDPVFAANQRQVFKIIWDLMK